MKKISLPVFLAFITVSLVNISNAEAYNPEGFDDYIKYVKAMARRKEVNDETLSDAFQDVKFNFKVAALDMKQPERKNGAGFDEYKARVLTEKRINAARNKLNENRALLEKIQATYGVDKEVLVALWGVETGFGEIMGNFNVIDSLSTLAYEGRRREFFQDELIKALVIMQQQGIKKRDFKGSWAGAFGQTQFMPSTFFKYATDGDGDGKIDLWNSNADALASAANYLYNIGWQPNTGWGKKVIIPVKLDDVRFISKDVGLQLYQWKQLGVRYADGSNIPDATYNVSLIDPDGDYGSRKELYLITDNYRKILDWNRSTYFATTIGLMADALK